MITFDDVKIIRPRKKLDGILNLWCVCKHIFMTEETLIFFKKT